MLLCGHVLGAGTPNPLLETLGKIVGRFSVSSFLQFIGFVHYVSREHLSGGNVLAKGCAKIVISELR